MTINCSNSLAVFNQSDMTHKFFSNFTLSNLLLVLATSFAANSFANTVSGELNFLDASGAVTTTYQGGDSVVLQVVDGDRNGDPSTADSITVLLTSTTEDTGTPASASEPVAGDNTGDGTLSVVANGFETKTEDWTVTATYADEMYATFQVEGSVSGTQRDLTLDMMMGETSVEYTTDGGEVTLTLTQGSTRFFSVLDGFTFSTTAAEIEGETITLDETGADTGVFTKTVVLNETDVSVLGNGELEAILVTESRHFMKTLRVTMGILSLLVRLRFTRERWCRVV